MFQWLTNLFKRKSPSYKVWAYRFDCVSKWSKVVSVDKPSPDFTGKVVGPFRSEVDCEEFCSEQNATMYWISNEQSRKVKR
jgi:hypothetical protein